MFVGGCTKAFISTVNLDGETNLKASWLGGEKSSTKAVTRFLHATFQLGVYIIHHSLLEVLPGTKFCKPALRFV